MFKIAIKRTVLKVRLKLRDKFCIALISFSGILVYQAVLGPLNLDVFVTSCLKNTISKVTKIH